MTSAQAEAAFTAPKPMLVYVYDLDQTGAREAVEAGVFQTDRVAIVARFFDCVRIDDESAAQDRALKESVKGKGPHLLFVRPNFEVAQSIAGRLNANRVHDAMVKTLRSDFGNDVPAVLKAQQELLKERAAIERDRSKLQRLEQEIAEEAGARSRAELEKERDALQEKIRALEGGIEQREQALYVLEPKTKA
ncbi:MAG: hypothetical protein ACREID_04370 [Planctomycetota bacterium]